MPEKYYSLVEKLLMISNHLELAQDHVKTLVIVDNINKDYSLDESRFKNTVKSFGTSDRPAPEDRSKKLVPGPGYYEIFSEFPSISN